MARPIGGYRDANGMKIPGSTSVLKNINTMDTDILCNWAAKMQREGKDWRVVRRSAGAMGSILHDLCENRLPNALDPLADRPGSIKDASFDAAWEGLQKSYEAIRAWYVKYGPKVVYAEEPLGSDKYLYAGTPDAVVVFPDDIPEYGVLAGQPWLLDYKTGRIIGAKEVAQMASYRQLLSENSKYDVRGAILIHAPTTAPGHMQPVVLDSLVLDRGWLIFEAALVVERQLPALREVFE
jgi:hypothetical protein